MQKRALALAAVLITVCVSGCSAPAATPTVTPTPSVTPLFASDADALAAAEDAYAEYQAMEDTISHEGGKDPDRIRPFAARQALEDALDGFDDFRKKDLQMTGEPQLSDVILISRSSVDTAIDVVHIRACLDVSAVDLLDAEGISAIPADRQSKQTFDLVFDETDGRLVLSARGKSEDQSRCPL